MNVIEQFFSVLKLYRILRGIFQSQVNDLSNMNTIFNKILKHRYCESIATGELRMDLSVIESSNHPVPEEIIKII